MTVKTPHYKLDAFTWGDVYSSSLDKRRMTIIDNQLAFLSTMAGDGKISGWEVTIKDLDNRILSISPGVGIINNRVMQSFGVFDFTVENNKSKYVYIQSKTTEMAGVSGHSNISNIICYDSTPPSSPSGLMENLTIPKSYNQLVLKWDNYVDVDFSHYLIKKQISGIFTEIDTTRTNGYIDTGLNSNTTYNYQIISVDYSGNESIPTSISLITSIDSRIPIAPSFMQIFPGNNCFQVVWDASPSTFVDSYDIVIQPLTSMYENDGEPTTISVYSIETNYNSGYAIIDGLENGKDYNVSIYAVNTNGGGIENKYSSAEVYQKAQPNTSLGSNEINNLSIIFEQSQFSELGIEADISWKFIQNEYLPAPTEFAITLIENGNRVAEPIAIYAGQAEDYTYHLQVVPFLNEEGRMVHESIKEYTPYTIIIQTITDDGISSNGSLLRVARTPSYRTLTAVSNVAINRNTSNNDLIITWDNSPELYLDYNKITINIIDLGTVIPSNLITELNISKNLTYTIDGVYFSNTKRYEVIITPVDIFGRDGTPYEIAKQFTNVNQIIPRPVAPDGLSTTYGDTQILLTWNFSTDMDIASYKIYRVDYESLEQAADFTNIGVVPSSQNSFIDYNVINETTYAYFVTAVSVNGDESMNPTDDYYPTMLQISVPYSSNSISVPTDLSLTWNENSPYDVTINWSAAVGTFDGYEIYRSIGNDFTFQYISYTTSNQTTYIDENILLENNQTYYYFIRTFKNEVTHIETESIIPPINSILIASIVTTTENGDQKITIDNSAGVNLSNLTDPIKETIQELLDKHKHTMQNGKDKRIELRSNSNINEWTTTDYQVYTTEYAIGGAERYVVKVTADIDESFFIANGYKDVAAIKQAQSGICPIKFSIDSDKNQIIFASPLYSTCEEPEPDPLNPTEELSCSLTPFVTEPIISLELINQSEVQNTLSPDLIDELSATQLSTGQLNIEQLPKISHEGRLNEKLVPIRLQTNTTDNFTYVLKNTYEDADRNKIGTATSFYDIIGVQEDLLLAATSSGILFSNDFGNSWTQKQTFPTPVHKLYKSTNGRFFALTNSGVYRNTNDDSFSNWTLIPGLEFVKNIRDITEDIDENIYITTNLGVFKLNKVIKPFIADAWEQLSIFGPRSTDAYAIIYNPIKDSIIISNEFGILETLNRGSTWNYVNYFNKFEKVYAFSIKNNYIFALTNTSLYNINKDFTDGSSFVKVATIDATKCRKFIILNQEIYISTDIGIQKVTTNADYNNTNMTCTKVLPLLNIRNKTVIVTSLNIIDGKIFIGTDRRLFVIDESDKIWLLTEQHNTIIPSIYVNNELSQIGTFFNNGGSVQNFSFDEKLDTTDVVEIVNKYTIYQTEHNGWAEQKFDAQFEIINNEILFAESTGSINIDYTQFTDLQLPLFDDLNSNYITANSYYNEILSNLTTLKTHPTGNDLRVLITNTLKYIQMFLSQIHKDSRVITTTVNGITTTSPFVWPKIKINLVNKAAGISPLGQPIVVETLVGGYVDAMNGLFVFETPFDIYDEMIVNIYGCTISNSGELSHTEIEDAFEIAYSGLPSNLSQIQQINLNKLCLFNEYNWINQQKDISTPVQAEYFTPLSLDWIDTLNSTINYEEQITYTSSTISLNYVSSVLFDEVSNIVYVGGDKGVLIINEDTLNINKANIISTKEIVVRQICKNQNKIYVLTNEEIFTTTDDGSTWIEEDRSGLPNRLYSLGFVYNNIIIGAQDGIYYKASEEVAWERSKESNTPVEIIFTPDLLFTVVDNIFYTSGDGYNFTDLGITDVYNVTKIDKLLSTIYVSTDTGLYTDTGTFYSSTPSLSLVNITDDINESQTLSINDITVGGNKMIVALSDATYYELINNKFYLRNNLPINTIHKIYYINNNIWTFGYDMAYISNIPYPIRLTTGVPI